MNTRAAILISAFILSASQLRATTLEDPNGLLRLEVNSEGPEVHERISIKESGFWTPTLSTDMRRQAISEMVIGRIIEEL